MIFSLFKKRRRRRILTELFSHEWRAILEANVAHFSYLSASEQHALEQCVQVFVAEKRFEGCGGMTISDEVKLTIAGQACLILLGIEHDYYRNVKSILVYPGGWQRHRPERSVMVSTHILGEAHYRGPIILAWDSVRHGGINPHDGRNLVYHEFAHKLDMLDGMVDGTPAHLHGQQFHDWVRVMTEAYEHLRARARKGQATLLDQYAATNPGEFFAVATECFFERPVQMQQKHADLYDVLRAFYNQHPAQRLRGR